MNGNPIKISCPSCAGSMGYDILRQSYACPYCHQTGDSRLAQNQLIQWRHMKSRQQGEPLSVVSTSCPSCGASVLFAKGEVSNSCGFCGGNLVLDAFIAEEQLPDIIIPFVLTREDAVERLEGWIRRHPFNKASEVLKKNTDKLEACYLPYRLVKGPIAGTISRSASTRDYYCEGYLEGNAIHSSSFFNNELLETIEPFDWDEAKPFSLGYVGGHRVKLANLSEKSLRSATEQEVSQNFRPVVERVMQTGDLRIDLSCSQLLQIPALLPVYSLSVRGFQTVINGQTGRISVDTKKVKDNKFRWLLEPSLLTILCTCLTCLFVGFSLELMLYSSILFALIIFVAFEQMRGYRNRRKIYSRGKSSRAKRIGKTLRVDEGNNLIRNPFSNQPVFYEMVEGVWTPVRIRFYTIPRLLWMLSELLLIFFLPAIGALLIGMLLRAAGSPLSLSDIRFEYGAPWYIVAFFVCLVGYIKGLRGHVYNHPILYHLYSDGTTKKIGSPASRWISFFQLFQLDRDILSLRFILGILSGILLFFILSVWAMFP